jgi:hypothetical protein
MNCSAAAVMTRFYDVFAPRGRLGRQFEIDTDLNVVRLIPVFGKIVLIPELADLPIRRCL